MQRALVVPEKVVHELFQGVAAKKLAQKYTFAGFLLARIGHTANGGASLRHIVDQKNALTGGFLAEIVNVFEFNFTKYRPNCIFQARLSNLLPASVVPASVVRDNIAAF